LIGLGLMGRPMGMNLIKAGYPLAVWNRTASRADELVAAGAKLTKSPQEVAASADFLLTIVSDPPALEQVLWGPQGALPALPRGSIYVDSSTISPALARKIAAACAERGVRFLDAPVTGGDWGAKKGELLFMIGGDAETLKDAEPVLRVMGKKLFHLGPHGAGQTIKLAMNLILALQVDALAEALALVTGAGLAGEKLVEVLQYSMARSGVLDVKAVAICIDFKIIDRQVIDASGEDREVSAVQNRDIANDDVVTEFKTDRLVTPARLDGISRIWITEWSTSRIGRRVSERGVLFLCARLTARAHKSLAPDLSRPKDRNVLEVLTPDQAVVKVAVTKVLITVPLIRLRRIVRNTGHGIGGDNRGSLIEV